MKGLARAFLTRPEGVPGEMKNEIAVKTWLKNRKKTSWLDSKIDI